MKYKRDIDDLISETEKEGVSIELYKEAREMIMQLDDIEVQAMLIMVESMTAGETHQEAPKSRNYYSLA